MGKSVNKKFNLTLPNSDILRDTEVIKGIQNILGQEYKDKLDRKEPINIGILCLFDNPCGNIQVRRDYGVVVEKEIAPLDVYFEKSTMTISELIVENPCTGSVTITLE